MNQATQAALDEFKKQLDAMEAELTRDPRYSSPEWRGAFAVYRALRDEYIRFGHGEVEKLLAAIAGKAEEIRADAERSGRWLDKVKGIVGAVGQIAGVVGKANPLGFLLG